MSEYLKTSSKKEDLQKVKQNFQEILKTVDDVFCTEHTKLKTIYIENHPDTPGKGGFICDYCSNPTPKIKFYSQILSDYSNVINQIKIAAKKNTEFSQTQKLIDQCSEFNSHIELSTKELISISDEFEEVFIPGILAKLATSEELLKLNEILNTITFNEQGRPIYENIGKHPEREQQYVKLANILISFKGENFDMNQKFSESLKLYLKKIVSKLFEIVNSSTGLINFLTKDFYSFVYQLDGENRDEDFLKSLNFSLYKQSDLDNILFQFKDIITGLEIKLKETQEKLNTESQMRKTMESQVIEMSQKSNMLKILGDQINSEISIKNGLLEEKAELLRKLNLLSAENSNLNVKLAQLVEETKQYCELTDLNYNLLNDLKKQVSLNRTLEMTVQDLQEKLNIYSARVQANETLIKSQLEIIKRFTEDKPTIQLDQKTDLLNHSRVETDIILEKIENFERKKMYKSVVIPFDSKNGFGSEFPISRSGYNSAYRPSSPISNSSSQLRSTFVPQNMNKSFASLLDFNNSSLKTIENTNDHNTNFLFSESSRISDKYRNNRNINHNNTSSKKGLKITFSSDLLLNGNNWENICNWIDEKQIYSQPIQPKLLFKATRDGFTAEEFQKRCIGVNNTLVIARTNYGKIIGGFTPLAWELPKEPFVYYLDPTGKTFIFSCSLGEKYDLKENEYAICVSQMSGPIFGGGSDFEIVDECNALCNNSSNVGHSFKYPRKAEEFYGDLQYMITEYEVYQIL